MLHKILQKVCLTITNQKKNLHYWGKRRKLDMKVQKCFVFKLPHFKICQRPILCNFTLHQPIKSHVWCFFLYIYIIILSLTASTQHSPVPLPVLTGF